MLIKRVVKTEDGNVEATMMLTMEQVAFLVNVGLATLVQHGAVNVQDMSEAEFKEEMAKKPAAEVNTPVPADSDEAKKFLEVLDVSNLPKN